MGATDDGSIEQVHSTHSEQQACVDERAAHWADQLRGGACAEGGPVATIFIQKQPPLLVPQKACRMAVGGLNRQACAWARTHA